MGISIPGAINYPSPLVALPSRVLSQPREGNKTIPCQIDWATMGGTNQSVYVNLQNNATLEFSQIVALKVDNSLCGATVRFIFTDTMEVVSIPAYTPDAIIEVFTNQTQFYVVADGAIPTDLTLFQILNFLPPPVVVPTSVEQQVAVISNISSAAGGTVPVVPSTVNGTLENLVIQFGVGNPAAARDANIKIVDGAGRTFVYESVFVNTGIPANIVLTNLSDVALRFTGGLSAVVAGTGIAGGEFNVNAYYRLP